jgi:hypothetical protein
MSRETAKKFIVVVGAFSTAVAFIGELTSDGIKSAFLMTFFVALLVALTGAVGLRMFRSDRENG